MKSRETVTGYTGFVVSVKVRNSWRYLFLEFKYLTSKCNAVNFHSNARDARALKAAYTGDD